MFTIKVTPVWEDGGHGSTILHTEADYRYTELAPADETDQELIVTVDGVEHRYSLSGHMIEILPPTLDEPEPVGDEQSDELGATPDDVRAAYLEVQGLRDQITAVAAEFNATDDQVAGLFELWAPSGHRLEAAPPGLLRNFLSAMRDGSFRHQLTK